ncbi:MAG: SRPBCC family protein [Actinomycetota bacterium]|nr:SRPBCC family protein [Actinomycetota bacterium]MDA2971473.1 SRPBCC family protein [Actinomycetota bacterium]MDA3000744.1 SRPBCC family protein [Actinomycetota bacterium]
MADTASLTISIAAPLERCWAIATDFEKYPEWATDVKSAVVRRRDAEGRAIEVEFRTSALGRSTHYVLAYDYSAAPHRLAWKMVSGDIMRAVDGAYMFAPDASGGVVLTYNLSIDLIVPLPGFVKRRAEVRILNTVKELKVLAES